MNNDSTPYTALLVRLRAYSATNGGGSVVSESSSHSPRLSVLSPRSEEYCSTGPDYHVNDLGGNETLLLDMVRARSKELAEEAQDKTLDLPKDDTSVDEDDTSEACIHGLSMRMTERSVSRSRVSRISTRRDMDIPSILAFTTNVSAPVHLEIPAFQKVNATPQVEEIPRWSIRRSVCPVCSQKWRDRSSITNVKYSGLKKNSSSELPSVIAPARLRTSITIGYVPRPTLASVDEEAGLSHGGLRNSSAAWQLTRARRFRVPKPPMPSPEAVAPPSASAPLARKDLDQRVSRFLAE
ncbi:uncharacterized protein LOC126373929 [Pectinophora gossypiella]|nr:uncharacterized protein LOC126370912 [Pectinophora gossypiella]XP_049876238.1 uncharacterized protein LOC126373929 [Pectinophora gossypiella]